MAGAAADEPRFQTRDQDLDVLDVQRRTAGKVPEQRVMGALSQVRLCRIAPG